MITPGRLPLVGFRNAPFVYGIAMSGIDFRGATIAAQVRLIADTPGDPLATFTVQNSFAKIEGLPYTSLTISISEAVMAGLPRSGELGSPSEFAWDLVATPAGGFKSVYLLGSFTVLPGVTYA